MKKRLASVLAVLLALAVCLSLAACGEPEVNGAKVGDTFDFSGRVITLTEIAEGTGRAFTDVDEPEGKYVTFNFSISEGDSSFNVTGNGITLNGKAPVSTAGDHANGAILKEGSSLKTTEGLTFSVLFDVDEDTSLDKLELKITK